MLEVLEDGDLDAQEVDHRQLMKELKDLPWSFIITRDARQTWANMDWPFRCARAPLHCVWGVRFCATTAGWELEGCKSFSTPASTV